ncbi:gp53-like domain-containing protein [Sphingomonas phyllosphaerae]|uniref:gp53-like domain-containing protein n=1 Tax=Sphingomonas phyllosphaerae TaxID=257003 RepID=UPI000417FA91|nr:hypothetical protein [Sphingomonas phyllosphaerae]
MALQLVITNAGRAAIINQASGGFRAVRIAAVGVSPTPFIPLATMTSLFGEVKRIASVAGEATATDVVHITVTDESNDVYAMRSFALYLSDGTLFAIYGQADPIVEKASQALLLLALDVTLAEIPAANITFGNANFTNPAATTDRAGVIELATIDEAKAGTDAQRAITPATARGAIKDWIGYTPVQQGTGVGQQPNVVKIGWSGFKLLATVDASAMGAFVMEVGSDTVWRVSNDGAGSGLDADLLDGQDGSWYTDIAKRLGFTPVQQGTGVNQKTNVVKIGWSGFKLLATVDAGAIGSFVMEAGDDAVWRTNNDGAGSGLDADLLDGQQGSWYSDVPARLGFTPIQQGTGVDQKANVVKIGWSGFKLLATVDTGAIGSFVMETKDDTVWRTNNDGAGSGLDADLLDGKDGSWYTDVATRLGFTPVQQGTGVDQKPNVVKIGWSGFKLLATVDTGAIGSFVMETKDDTVWRTNNDGAGSGLDADLLDGNHASDFALSSHKHVAADISAAFTGSLSGNGYTVLPNGLILQWVTGAQQAASSEGTQYVAFPISFNTCFQVITSTQVANPNIESHAVYQLISYTTEGATVMRQLVSSSGADREPSWPRLFAIGK